MKTNKKPNFLIIGAMKAATTSLYAYLKEHPEIYLPSIKEPMFFNSIEINDKKIILKGRAKKKITSFKKYYNLFQNVNKEIAIGEASPGYLYNSNCDEEIHIKPNQTCQPVPGPRDRTQRPDVPPRPEHPEQHQDRHRGPPPTPGICRGLLPCG